METLSRSAEPAHSNQAVLASWKSIAGYFGCNERTAKRWEERGLPVHRVPGGKRGYVFAYPSELDAWLQTMKLKDPELASEGSVKRLDEGFALRSVAGGIAATATVGGPSQVASLRPFASGTAVYRNLFWGVACLATILAAILSFRILSGRNVAGEEHGRSGDSLSASRHVPAPGAEELYLQGRYFWNLRTADGLSKAINAFTQAIVRDPSYADAYAGLAESYDLLPEFANANLNDSLLRAKDAADRAIALNPNLAAAHRAKAFALYFRDWDIAGSDAEFQRALALEPGSAETHLWYASSLECREEGAEALKQIDEARRLNPASPAIASEAALFQADFGDLGAGIKALKDIEQTQPNLSSPAWYLAVIDFAIGDFPGYIASLRRYGLITGNPEDVALADAAARGWAQGGKTGLLEARAKGLKATFDHGSDSSGFYLGQTLVMLGRPKEALTYFKASLNSRIVVLTMLQDCPWGKPLANDPEYVALFAEIRERQHGGHPHPPAMVRVTLRVPN
jgi:tetratricopeptide (TPR) repeat protein